MDPGTESSDEAEGKATVLVAIANDFVEVVVCVVDQSVDHRDLP